MHRKSVIAIIAVGLLILGISFSFYHVWKSDVTLARALIRIFPNDYRGYSLLGKVYFKERRYDLAQEAFTRSLELGARDPSVHYMLGVTYRDYFSKAKKHFELALVSHPEYAAPYNGLGKLYFERRIYRDALPYFEKGLNLNPSFENYQYLLKTYVKLRKKTHADQLLYRAKDDLSAQQLIALMALKD